MTDNLPPPTRFDAATTRETHAVADAQLAELGHIGVGVGGRVLDVLHTAVVEIESLSARLASATEEREKWESRANAYEHESNKHLDLIDRVSQLEGALREIRKTPLATQNQWLIDAVLSAPNHPSEQPDADEATPESPASPAQEEG
jgi:hypothetical protein